MIDVAFLKGKTVAVFGLGKAGLSTINALQKAGAEVFAFDDGDAAVKSLGEKKLPNVTVKNPNDYNWKEVSLLVLSPGVPFTHPKPHYVVDLAKAAGCPIVCDIELLYNAQKQAKFIGITGTNGKSTTTALTGHILKECAVKSAVGGNIGVPVLDLDMLGGAGYYVVEMSSYQLDLIDKTHFNVSILLNVTPDHIDRHGDMEGYVKAKSHIFENQGAGDTAIIGLEDEYCEEVYEKLRKAGKISNLIGVSTDKKLEKGVAVLNGVIYDNYFTKSKFELGYLKRLPGKHNAQNIAMAYCAALAVGIYAKKVVEAIKTFGGLPHRMQYVAEIEGVRFVNDSKATNAEAASKALVTFDNIYWIAGGMAKDGGIESLDEFFPKIKQAYLIGKAQDEFAKTIDGKIEYKKCETLDKAFAEAQADALKNKNQKPVVLLSPACASFDQWPNFEVRGNAFCEMVKKLVDSR